MQACNDTDFEFELKFDSTVDSAYQLQGILIEQDSANFIVSQFDHNGANPEITYGIVVNGGEPSLFSQAIPDGAPLYMRVNRTGDVWTVSYSQDGQSWTVADTFTRVMTVTSVGLFSGNFSYGVPPAHTAVIDYFQNNASPLSP